MILCNVFNYHFIHLDNTEGCPSGWYGMKGNCYKFSTTTKTWTSANANCKASGGYLTSILSNDEQAFLEDTIKSKYDALVAFKLSKLFSLVPG